MFLVTYRNRRNEELSSEWKDSFEAVQEFMNDLFGRLVSNVVVCKCEEGKVVQSFSYIKGDNIWERV